MLIEEHKLLHWINHFYGYGSWESRFWFIAFEESGGEIPEEVADKLNYFHREHPTADSGILCDLREMYKHVAIRWDGPKANLFQNRFDFRFGEKAVLQGVWKNLVAFIHGYQNKKLPDILRYQRQKFALTSTNQEALISFYPLPAPHSHAWYYSWLDLPGAQFIRNRKEYEARVYPNRIKTILTKLKTYQPEVVLMYGMNNINTLKKSIVDFFPDIKFNQVKAIRQWTPQHHRADVNGSKLLITTQIPALRHGRVETGFNWEEFGKSVST